MRMGRVDGARMGQQSLMVQVLIALAAIAVVVWLLRNASGEMYTTEDEMFGRDEDAD